MTDISSKYTAGYYKGVADTRDREVDVLVSAAEFWLADPVDATGERRRLLEYAVKLAKSARYTVQEAE